jgi:hypothetical protein
MATYKRRPKRTSDGVKIHGFTKVRFTDGTGEPGSKIIGESDWSQNVVVNEGFDDYLCRLVGGTTSSKHVNFIALGTGTKPGAADTGLDGEIMGSTERKAPTVGVTSSKTLRFTATFYSSDSFLTGSSNLQNVGLFASSAANQLFAGNTYTSSTCNTNQNVNVTYDIQFS